jgi:hypothetical protein
LGRSPLTDTIDKGQQNDVRPSENNQGITMKLSFAKKKTQGEYLRLSKAAFPKHQGIGIDQVWSI